VRQVPDPPLIGRRDGLAYALFLPTGEPEAGIVVVHGAGSAKESHYDFGRAARGMGLAAVCFDLPGHGESEGEFGPSALDAVAAMLALVREHAPRAALRGSSLGGFCSLHAAALDREVAAVVAICPATEDLLLRGLRSERLDGFRCDRPAAERWLEAADTRAAVASLAPRTALLLLHAEGDEQVPYTVSQDLHAAAGEPKRLLVLPGGHHRSIQHDGELQGESLRFVLRFARPRPG
jgi:uncharacterized protein